MAYKLNIYFFMSMCIFMLCLMLSNTYFLEIYVIKVTTAINRKLLRDIPKVLVSLGMCISTFQPQAVNIGFMYSVILDGRIIGYVPNTLTEFFIRKLRQLKVQGNQVNIS